MKQLFIILSAGFILAACSDASTEPDEEPSSKDSPSSADSLALNYSEILDYYGKLYNTIDRSMAEGKNKEYYEGISDNAQITLQTALVYDQLENLSYEHLSEYISDEEIEDVKEINSYLYDATYNLTELMKEEDFDKESITPYLTELKAELDVSGVSSSDLNYFNLIRNPRAVAEENSEQEITELINQMLDDARDFFETTHTMYSS
ncbi:hypothetical protein [Halobacillus andaensis]|uniref:hypothetical protein n=1 Tax=Halobacillus andaensis TaxID=1176239 RepID=UPI003D732AC6